MDTFHEDRACLKQWEEFQVRFWFESFLEFLLFRLVISWSPFNFLDCNGFGFEWVRWKNTEWGIENHQPVFEW